MWKIKFINTIDDSNRRGRMFAIDVSCSDKSTLWRINYDFQSACSLTRFTTHSPTSNYKYVNMFRNKYTFYIKAHASVILPWDYGILTRISTTVKEV